MTATPRGWTKGKMAYRSSYKEGVTYSGSGYGLRRSWVEVFKDIPSNTWNVQIWKFMGYHEDPEPLPRKQFSNKTEAMRYALNWMRKNNTWH